MSIVYSIPANSYYVKAGAYLRATFNTPDYPGKYSFAYPLNSVAIHALQKNCLYLIERYSVSFSIDEGTFFRSIDVSLPFLEFKLSNTEETVLNRPLLLCNYRAESQLNKWIFSDQSENYLLLKLTGVLAQLPEMIGMEYVNMYIDLTIFEIHDNAYINAWKNGAINQFANGIK